MACGRIKKNTNKICISDLDKRVIFQITSITGTNSPDISTAVGFTNIATVWAMIKTRATTQYINGVNIEVGISTDIYIRYNSNIDITKQLYIEYNSAKYKVINAENIDKENDFIRFRCVEHGDKTINANLR
jgi:SPP1 family predicted phage head-tail adaptor